MRLSLDDAGAIAALNVGGERFSETEGIGSRVREEAFTSQFIGKKPPLQLSDIDAVSRRDRILPGCGGRGERGSRLFKPLRHRWRVCNKCANLHPIFWQSDTECM